MYHVKPSPYRTKSAQLNCANLAGSILLGCVQFILMQFTTVPFSLIERWVVSFGLIGIVMVSATMLYGQRQAWSFHRLVVLGLLNGILWVLVYPSGSAIIRVFTPA